MASAQLASVSSGRSAASAWLPLFIHLHQPSIHSPLFTRTHQLPDEVAAFTDSEWQILHSHYALFWLVQGMGQLTEPCNLYEVNALHRVERRLLLHSQKPDAFKWEESTYFMPHSAEGRYYPRVMRVIRPISLVTSIPGKGVIKAR